VPSLPFTPQVRDLLERPNPCVISTLRRDGHPVSVATWYLLRGDRVLVNMDEGRKRLENLRRDGRVALTVLAEDDWSVHVSLAGRVVELYDDDGLVDVDELCRHYGGDEFAVRDRTRVSALVEVDRWHVWGTDDED
jgi:PPOX class probable F420-dependent enzyme